MRKFLVDPRARLGALAFAVVATISTAAIAQPPKNSFASIAKAVEPAVVSIDTKSKVVEPVAKGTPQPGDSEDILDFFRRQAQQRPVMGVGSGFIVDKGGYILTNRHVVIGSERISVRLETGEELPATVIGTDMETDLAVIKVSAGRDLPFLKFGNSANAEVGDWVLAVGSPFGLAKSVTAGIISQKQRETPYATAFQRFIQTDAAINPGNSGGPLVNLDGEVVGVNSQIATSTGEYSGVGFALPSEQAQAVYQQIVRNGRVRRGYLGAYLDSVKAEFAKVYGLDSAKGAIVTDIRDKQAAAAVSGLKVGDVIVEINGKQVENANDLIARIAATEPDQPVTLVYYREAGTAMERKTVSLKLGERPSNDRASAADAGERRVLPIDGTKPVKPFGLTLVEMTPALATSSNFTGQKGLLVRDIDPVSYIADVRNSLGASALQPGDLIQRINRQYVTDLKSFGDTVAKLKPGDAVVMNVLFFNPQLEEPQLKIVQFTVK